MRQGSLSRPIKGLIILAGLIGLWQAIVWITSAPVFILPGPGDMIKAWTARPQLFLEHGAVTLAEILLGLGLGILLGGVSALGMAAFAPVRSWLMPVLVISQAIPVFAIAPVLVLWLGYGLGSKVAMATLIIFFPVTAAFLDGLRRCPPGWIDLARTCGASRAAILFKVRLPAALPALASGIRVAVAVAPIGAVVGEWVGSSAGLGYLMLHANGRMQIDVMFAALATLCVMAVALYLIADTGLRRLVAWQPESQPSIKG
ncbi:MAG: ABC transporter permease [Magnetovibrionaceae bacterium]